MTIFEKVKMTMDHIPTCPKCGCNAFRFNVLQRVEVSFHGDDHDIVDAPGGDIEWDDTVEAVCTDCDHTAPLNEMKGQP